MRLGRRLFSGAVVGTAVIAATFMAMGPASAESNGGVRVMPLGDSITDGVGSPGGYRVSLWSKLVADGYKIDFVGSARNGPASLGDHDHEGHSGWTIAQIDANITNWLRTSKPRTILLHIGTNDMYGSDPNGAPARLSTLLDHITTQAPDAELFVATIIPLSMSNAAVQTFNAKIPGIVQSRVNAGKHVHLVPMYDALTTADLGDGVHPNAGGYAKMATVWYNALRSVPASLTDGTAPSSAPASQVPSSQPPSSRPASSRPASSRPASSRPASSAPPSAPSSSGAAGACSVGYRTVTSWSGGYQAEVTVTAGRAPITGWTVTMTLASGQSISSLWNGAATTSGSQITVRNSASNGALAASAATTFGFVGIGNGSVVPSGMTCTSP